MSEKQNFTDKTRKPSKEERRVSRRATLSKLIAGKPTM
jgi:hypothetical protein